MRSALRSASITATPGAPSTSATGTLNSSTRFCEGWISGARAGSGKACPRATTRWVGTGFPKRSCSNKKIERDDDSKKSHPALANPPSQSSPRQRRHALDLDQQLWIGQRLHHAGGSRGVGLWSERARIQRIHRRDIGRARQEHIDLDQIAEGRAGLIKHAPDVFHDKAELRLEGLRQRALVVEAGN